MESETKPEKKKAGQRIKMRLYKHPVKLDGEIIAFAPDGSQFTVQFDGPLPDKTFYRYSESLVVDKPPARSGGSGTLLIAEGSEMYEVL